MYNPEQQPGTERNFPFMRPGGPTHGGQCNLKPEWHEIGLAALKEANSRGYKKHTYENYASLCDFVRQNSVQLFVEGLEGGLSGKILGAEIAFRNKDRYKEPCINDLVKKGIIEIIDMGELK